MGTFKIVPTLGIHKCSTSFLGIQFGWYCVVESKATYVCGDHVGRSDENGCVHSGSLEQKIEPRMKG